MHSTPPSRYDGNSGSSWHASVGKPSRTGFSADMRKRPPERERETLSAVFVICKRSIWDCLQAYIVQCSDTMSALIPDRARQSDRESERAVNQRQRERNRTRE